jgi:hypothetical protein
VAANIINGIFGGWLRSIFEDIKDKDSYDNEVSNLNKYGAGQETWDDYQDNSISAMSGKVTTIGWLIFIPACLIILFRKFGLHNKPIFDKFHATNQKFNEIRGVLTVKNVLLGLYLLLNLISIAYLCTLSGH